MIKIEISKYYRDRIEEFALECAKTNVSQYAKRGNPSEVTVSNNIVTGKMGEFGVYLYLKSLGFSKVTKPDLFIYGGKQKSYAPDLVVYKKDKRICTFNKESIISHKQFNIHCKTQMIERVQAYGHSWVLQYGGKGAGNRDDLFTIPTPYDIMALSYVDGNSVVIMGFYNFLDLCKKKLLKDPVLDYLKNIKKCIYFEDLEKVYGTDFKGIY